MAWREVRFMTTATDVEIRKGLAEMTYIKYLSIQGKRIKRREGMNDLKQLAMIYGSVFFAGLAVFMFIEWGTRP